MYLKKAIIENVGPISRFEFESPFNNDGSPQLIIIAGKNGSGKTIFLSHIIDALTEFASEAYTDISPHEGLGRKYFKITGPRNQKIGSSYGFSYLSFFDGDNKFKYLDKTGIVTYTDFHPKINNDLESNSDWKDNGNVKLTTGCTEEKISDIFGKGTYCFFPVNRFETPHWANKNFKKEKFSFSGGIKGKLGKPLVIQSSLLDSKVWLLDLVLDQKVQGSEFLWDIANKLLQEIIQDQKAFFGITKRNDKYSRISIGHRNDQGTIEVSIPSLDNLSTGQIVLLNMFFSIIRYADTGNITTLNQITGIVIIDEIDIHLHTNLQVEILPKLISMFPNIQFIISTHSPLFILGLHEKMNGKFKIVELPTGSILAPENFSEFTDVFDVIKRSVTFENEIKKLEEISDSLPLLMVEGPSDKTILTNAWEVLFPKEKMNFTIIDGYDCFFVKSTISRGIAFKNNPKRKIIGLLDFDKAYDLYVKLSKEKGFSVIPGRTDKTGLIVKNKENLGYLALLPVPDNRKLIASSKLKDSSCLSIELLFDDSIIKSYCTKKLCVGGYETLKFKDDKKISFSESTSKFTKDDFVNFKPIFNLVKHILKNTN